MAPKHIDNPESAAKAPISHGDENLSQTIVQLPTGYFHHVRDQQAGSYEANSPVFSLSKQSNAAIGQTDKLRLNNQEQVKDSIMAIARSCLHSFDQLVEYFAVVGKGSFHGAPSVVLQAGFKPDLQFLDEWCDEQARFKLAMNDLKIVLNLIGSSTDDQNVLQVTDGLRFDLKELSSNMDQVVAISKGERLPYQEIVRQGQEAKPGVIGENWGEPDELAVRLQSTADTIDDLFRSTKLLRRCQTRGAKHDPETACLSPGSIRRFSQCEMEDATSDHSPLRALDSKVQADQRLKVQHQRLWALFFADTDKISQMTAVPEERRLLEHGRDLYNVWEKFQRQLQEELRLPLQDKSPSLLTLLEAIELAQRSWQAAREETKFGRVKSIFAKVARSMEDHSQILKVLPYTDEYVSLIIGSMTCIVKATINHEDIALALSDSLEQLCEDIMHWKEQVLAHPDLAFIQRLVQELYVVVFQYLTNLLVTWSSSGWKRFTLSFNKNVMTKLSSTRQAQMDRLSERINRAAELHEQKSIQAILTSVVTKAELDDALLELGGRIQTYLGSLDLERQPQRSSYSDSSQPLKLMAPEQHRVEDNQPPVHAYPVDKQEIIRQIPDFERLLNLPVNDSKTHSHRATHLEPDWRAVQKLHEWLHGAVGSNIWIQGPPVVPLPSRKTLAAISLMVALQSGRCPVLSFFCDSIRTAQLSPRQILSELVHCFIAQLVPHLPSVIRGDQDLSPPRFFSACSKDTPVEDKLALLMDIVNSVKSPMYLLIDGVQALEQYADAEHTKDLSRMVEYLCGTDAESKKSSAKKVCFTSDGFVDALALQAQRGQLEKVSFELESDDVQADDVASFCL